MHEKKIYPDKLEIFNEICNLVRDGLNIVNALKSDNRFPPFKTFCQWRRDDVELDLLYLRAREDKADGLEGKLDQILEDLKENKIDPRSAHIMVGAIQWKMAKMYPKMFGDSTRIAHEIPRGITSIKIEIDEAPQKPD